MEPKHIETRLARAATVPILPDIAMRVLRLADNPNAGAREYELVIAKDAGLTAKILRTANAPYYGSNGQITTLQRALTQLGVNAIRSICLTVSFQSAMASKQLNKRFHVGHFWQHSLATACAAKILSRLHGSRLQEEAFVAGLVHDIGKLALCMFLPLESNRVYDVRDNENLTDCEAEQDVLGLTHQDIGLKAAQLWHLPEMYHAPISTHHTPTEDVFEIDPLTAYVHVADALSYEINLGFGKPGYVPEMDYLVVDFLGISEAQYDLIRTAVLKEVLLMSKYMGL